MSAPIMEGGERYMVQQGAGMAVAKSDEQHEYAACIHNIKERKLLEEAQKNREMYDSVTTFYRLHFGMKQMEQAYQRWEKGVLALLDIRHFTFISEKYGLVFADIIMEQLATILKEEDREAGCEDIVYIRAGADKMLLAKIWADEDFDARKSIDLSDND